MASVLPAVRRRTIGVLDIPRVLVQPRAVFARVEDVPAWRWPLLILLTLVTLIGYATIETGLIDREVDRGVNTRIAQIDQQQRDVVERSELRKLYEREKEMGEFGKLLARMKVIVMRPAEALATALLVAAVLYGMVALSGRKPEWNTLLTICVLAGFTDALRLLVTLGLMLHFRSLAVDTSLAPATVLLARQEWLEPAALNAVAGMLTAIDPFRIWYWLVVIIGAHATSQLPGWRAWVPCVVCWLAAAGGRTGVAMATLQSASQV